MGLVLVRLVHQYSQEDERPGALGTEGEEKAAGVSAA